MLEWKAISRDVMASTDGGFKITSRVVAPHGMEYKLYRGDQMQGRLECRNNVVERTETIDELKQYALELYRLNN